MQEMSNVVRAVALPPGASIAPLYPGSNLADAYAVELPTAQARQMDMQSLARVLLGSQPRWAQWLMVLRDAIVSLLRHQDVEADGSAARRAHRHLPHLRRQRR